MAEETKPISTYNEDNIIHLDDREHIRRRPGNESSFSIKLQ